VNTIGRYQLVEPLGQGGMGTVYKAFDPSLARVVAVKIISAQLGVSQEHHERFFREARAAAHLSHRNIITIHDLGEENGTPFLAMEFLEGRDLEQRMRANEHMQLARKLEIALGVCDGLAHAHACGIIHRDVKPANIFITDAGDVKLLDFGLARLVTSEITRSHVMLGTVNYMAPEQIRGEKLDHRADVFSLGAVLYELFGGRKAFKADSFASTLYRILQETPEPLDRIAPEVSTELSGLVERAMAKAREDRYQHVTDISRDLERVYTGTHGADLRFVRTWETAARARPASQPHGPDVSDAPTMAGTIRSGDDPAGGSAPPAGAGSSAEDDPTVALPVPSAQGGTTRSGELPGPAVTSAPATASTGRRGWIVVAGTAAMVAAVGLSAWLWRPIDRRPDVAAPPQTAATPAAARPVPPLDAAAPERPVPSMGQLAEPPPAPQVATESPRLARAIREARSALAASRHEDAARLVGDVLRADPGNRDALALRGRITAEVTARAARAMEEMDAARRAAVSAGAGHWAANLIAAAEQRESAARGAFGGRRFAEASARAEEARALFHDAESAARRQAAADTERTRIAEAERRAAEAERARAEAARATPAPAPPTRPAPAPPPPPAGPPPEQAIGDVVRRYLAALEQRDLAALRAVWPTIGADQEAAIRADFENARSIEAHIRDLVVEVTGDTATATGQRRYVVRTRDGQRLQNDTTITMRLRRNGSQWVIQSVRYQAR
jgi:serine/threonine protein kinase